jgi:two-component system, OmpR family, alkaline phosphatase synthesis response regulator PhoP
MTEQKTILIAEDDRPLLKAAVTKFTNEGFTVLQAHDGREALQMSLDKHPDLILLDILMPKMDGMTVCKKLREDEWGKNVPIIFLTNLNDVKQVTEATEEGVYDYLVKSDWHIDDVVKKVREKLEM